MPVVVGKRGTMGAKRRQSPHEEQLCLTMSQERRFCRQYIAETWEEQEYRLPKHRTLNQRVSLPHRENRKRSDQAPQFLVLFSPQVLDLEEELAAGLHEAVRLAEIRQ